MPDYPRQINLDKDSETRLVNYIEDELMRHSSERGGFLDDLQRWQRDYNAEPSTTEATFPFQGASTLIIPLAAISLEAIHARIMTTLFALNQFTAVKSKHTNWDNTVQPLQKFLDHELIVNAAIYDPINNVVLEIGKFGSGVIKCGYEKITRTAVRPVGDDDKEEEFTVTVKQGITVDAIPVSRFLMPFIYTNPQTASWCGEEHQSTPYELRIMELSGKVKEGTFKALEAHFKQAGASNTPSSGSEFERSQQEIDNMVPIWPLTVDWVELWMGFDVDKTEEFVAVNGMPAANEAMSNKYDKEIVVYYHRDSKELMSVRYNQYSDLSRPYETGVYFPIEHRWNGFGVCKQVEQFQREITTQHRQRLDNATLANVRMIKINKLSGYGPNEPIFPGKMWFVDDMDDVQTMQLGEIYSSSYSNESQSLLYAQQRTGINEVNLGMPQVGTPGTATSDLARIQEGNKKFDFVYGNIKKMVNKVIHRSLVGIKLYGPHNESYYDKVEGGDIVRNFFNQDAELIRSGLLVEVTAAGQQENKLLDRQNWQQVTQGLQAYYDGMIALAERTGDQQLMQSIVKNGLTAVTEAAKQFLESFDIKNVDRIVFKEALENGTLFTSPTGADRGNPNSSQATGVGGGNGTVPQFSQTGAG